MAEDTLKTDVAIEVKDDPELDIHADLKVSSTGDLSLVSGKENVLQSIVNRLSTRRGELAELGHPGYGSELDALVGMPNTPESLRLIETYVRDALRSEPRIESVLRVEAGFIEGRTDAVYVEMDVRLPTGDAMTARVPVSLARGGP